MKKNMTTLLVHVAVNEDLDVQTHNREVLQSEIRMQIFVKLGLRTHESSDGPANRRVVLQTENGPYSPKGKMAAARTPRWYNAALTHTK